MKVRALLAAVVVVLTACSSAQSAHDSSTGGASGDPALDTRIAAIDTAIGEWKSATDLVAVHRAAESVRNLVVGSHGPGYGDADGDGTVQSPSEQGLLPGLKGEKGLVGPGADERACLSDDVLGGSWADPAARWAEAQHDVEVWSESNNLFPMLRSQPLRIYGWASLALASSDVATAQSFSEHAQMHLDVVMHAIAGC